MHRKRRGDMIQTYKIITEKINLNKDLFFKISRSATRGHNYKLYKQHANKLVRIASFSKRIVNDWNGLDPKVVKDNTRIQKQIRSVLARQSVHDTFLKK